jgi:SAM-dependent methyltransferase
MWGTGEKFSYNKCYNCGCLQIESYPIEIEKYYFGNYYSYEPNQSGFKRRLINYIKQSRDRFEAGLHKTFLGAVLSQILPNKVIRYQFNFLKSHLLRFRGKSILDVGCGSDRFLNLFDSNFFSKRVGIDPFIKESYAYVTERLEIQKKCFFELLETYDVIFFNHSLEHMPNQIDVFKKISKSLTKGGIAVIRVPVIDSFAWEKYGVSWIQIDPPRHFYLHTTFSVDYLARKSGMVVHDICFDSSSFQFWGSEQNLAGIPLGSTDSILHGNIKIISQSMLKQYEVMARKLNDEKKGDQAIFILKHANE